MSLTTEKRKRSLIAWGGAVASGLLIFLGYVGFDQFYLEWVSLVPLLWVVRGERPRRAFFVGWIAGIVGHAGGFYWAIDMFRQFAGAPWPAAALGLLLLAAANGVVVAAWAWGTRALVPEESGHIVWVAPVLWTAVEKFWPEVFPNYLGASQYRLPHLTQIADFSGILGVSFLVVYVNATVYWSVVTYAKERRLPRRSIAVLAAVLLLVLGYGEFRIRTLDAEIASAEKLIVGLVQTNRGAADAHLEPETILDEHRAMSQALVAQAKPDLVVWPEGVASIALSSRAGTLPTAALGDLGTPLLFGACLRMSEAGEGCITNSALLADRSGRILGSYDKTVLVPFGEYIPFGDLFPGVYSWSPYSSRFRAGTGTEPLRLGRHLLSVNICYEDIFPTHIRELMRGGRAGVAPQAMFNLTNDSWYGKSTEPMEHLALASFRSIENRRALVRVTNTGVSAVIDPVGRVVGKTGIWTREVLVAAVPLMNGRPAYAAAGDWIGWLCALLSVCGLLFRVTVAVKEGRTRSV